MESDEEIQRRYIELIKREDPDFERKLRGEWTNEELVMMAKEQDFLFPKGENN